MKANQAFVNNEEAVSPVIGVILMVAITVVLAAVVFVLVSDLGGGSDSAPSLSLQKAETDDRIELITSEPDLNWDEFQIKSSIDEAATTGLLILDLNGQAVCDLSDSSCSTGSQIVDDQYVNNQFDTADFTGGDYLDLCGWDDEGATGIAVTLTDVSIQILHTTSNSVVFDETFTSIAGCTTQA